MNAREFVTMVKSDAIDGSVQAILAHLRFPRTPSPLPESADPIQQELSSLFNAAAHREQRQAAWFAHLNKDQQQEFALILRECAELTAFSFFGLIDGVGGSYEGVFEIAAVDPEGRKKLLNPQDSEMLHLLLSEICVDDRGN